MNTQEVTHNNKKKSTHTHAKQHVNNNENNSDNKMNLWFIGKKRKRVLSTQSLEVGTS